MRNLHFRGLRRRLLLGGVAPKHVSRTIKELRHHFSDLEQKALAEGLSPSEATSQAREQLGNQELIIEEALARPELKSWAYRWPWGIYGLLPIALTVFAVAVSVFLVIGLIQIGEASSGLSPEAFAYAIGSQPSVRAFFEGWMLFTVYALPTVLAGGLCVFAANRDAPAIWPAVGVILIAYLGFSYNLEFQFPESPDQLGSIHGGIGWGPEMFLSRGVFRFFVPLALVLIPYYWWRHRIHREDSAT